MGSDSINNDLGRKKRTNRLAKLKKSKLDVRREQWLSQIKNKGCKVDSNGRGGSPPPSLLLPPIEGNNKSSNSSELRSRGVDIEGSIIHYSDLESVTSSPDGSNKGQNNMTKDLLSSSCSSGSSWCCSGSVSEAEEENGCLDDWEAVADALTANEKQLNPNTEPSNGFKSKIQLADSELSKNVVVGLLETESKGMVSRAQENRRAWRPDDAFRPQSLPNMLKQQNVDMNSSCGAIARAWQSIISLPSSCPICCEDLDLTDSSFLPCPCGFHLCLFCHKRILEADGRCPGCRKQYDPIKGNAHFNEGAASFQMGQSVSMSTRS